MVRARQGENWGCRGGRLERAWQAGHTGRTRGDGGSRPGAVPRGPTPPFGRNPSLLFDIKRSCLMPHVGLWPGLLGKVRAGLFFPVAYCMVLGKQNARSPHTQMGSAGQAQAGARGPPDAKLAPPTLPMHWAHWFSHPHICSPDHHHSPSHFLPDQSFSPQPSQFRAGRNRASFQRSTFSKPRSHSDWTSVGHMPTSEPIVVGGRVSVLTGRLRAGGGRVPLPFISGHGAGVVGRTPSGG